MSYDPYGISRAGRKPVVASTTSTSALANETKPLTPPAKPRPGGMGVASVLTLAFIILRLTGEIAWPWVWVLAPLWISVGVYVVAVIGVLLLTAAVFAANSARKP